MLRKLFGWLLCHSDEHAAPDNHYGEHAYCKRCGKRFDPAEQDQRRAEEQTFSM